MAKIKILAAVVLLCVVSAVSYSIGCNKHYEDACHMSDLIRCYQDHLNEDSLIEDYGCFEELEAAFLHDDGIGNPVDLSKYSWCY
jgi:hypothetical protein